MSRTADLAFVNGTVRTMDGPGRTAQALAVAGERIAAVGSDAGIGALVGADTVVVDLAGGAVLPGINDSHLHAAMLGAYWPHSWLGFGGGFPEPRVLATDEDRRAALRRAWDVVLPLGVTSYTEPGLGPGARSQHGGSCDDAVLRVYRELAEDGELPVRVTALLLFGELDGPSDPVALAAGLRTFRPEPSDAPARWRVAGVKLFADGIPPMRTAWLSDPYADGGHGALLVRGRDDAERLGGLQTMIRAADAAGAQIGVHATGDRAIAETVRALAAAPHGRRHYVIHGDLVDRGTLELMARHDIGLNAQPRIPAATAQPLAAALGADRAARAVPLRSALDAGAPLCLSSDGPVLAPDWRRDLAAAALRGRAAGVDERIGVAAALRAYTATAAWQDGAESWKGTLEAGKVADLCVVDRDPLAVRPEELSELQVRLTVVGGRVAFGAGGAPGTGAHRA